ncbi:MAG TPA: hypothetical protein VIM99_03720 [Blastocatellia bacterium]
MITVKVYHESSEDPAVGKIVSLAGAELKVSDSQFTDNDGEALFNVEPCEGRVFIFVNGSIAYKGYMREKIVVYV